MSRETIERKVMENASKMNQPGGLNAIAYALLSIAEVMNRTHDMAKKQIKNLEKLQKEMKEDM